MIRRAVPSIADLRHTKLCYRQDHYCGHPRQLPFHNYGHGEIVVGHYHAPARYATHDDVSHSSTTGYFSRAKSCCNGRWTTVKPGDRGRGGHWR